MSARNQAMTRSVQAMLEKIKRECFSPGYEASDTEAMGLLLSHFFDYDGADILRAAETALEDANFHAEAAALGEARQRLEPEDEPAFRVYLAPSDSRRGVEHRVVIHRDGHGTCPCESATYSRDHVCKHIRRAKAGCYAEVS